MVPRDEDDDGTLVDDPSGETVRSEYDPSTDDSLSAAVVDAVAAVTGRQPTDLPPLHDSVDTDALESLFGADSDGVTLTFPFGGVVVRVRDGDEILVYTTDDG